ncbi:MAG: translation initiation factor 1 [Candidatus Woesearchaeota archaeon]|jgi:translation initiation factor 1
MDDELWDKFGLPKELMAGEAIAKESQEITISIIKKKFGKKYTVIGGLDPKDIDIKDLAKKLKTKFACGGTHKQTMVELQGDYLSRINDVLVGLGFNAESINIKAGK